MALEAVQDYVALARELLQDEKDVPYRYSTASLVRALNLSFMEAKRLRPDLFIGVTLPNYTSPANDATVVTMNELYRMPLVYYMCYIVQLRDDEETQDQRAAAFRSLFAAQLTTVS